MYFEEDFRENCVENKAIFGTNYSIAKWIICKEGCYE